MIDLRINNQSLDLYPDTSISMEENSSVFSSDVMPGSFSMPFTIPASANNSRLLGFPEMLNLKDKPKLRYAAELIVEGVPYLSGEVIFRGFGDDKYKINFQSQLSLVNQYFQDTKLRDLGHEPVVILDPKSISTTAIASKHVEIWLLKSKKPDPVKFTVNGNNIEGSDFLWQSDLINQVAEMDMGIKLEITEDSNNYKFLFSLLESASYDTPIEIELSDDEEDPAFELKYCWHDGYDPLIQAAINGFLNNNVFDDDFVFPTVRNPSFYGDYEGSFSTDFNDYEDGEFIFKLFNGQRSSFIPMFSLAYIFRKIKEATGVEIVGDFVDHPDIEKLIFLNSFSLDMFEKTYPGQTSYAYHYQINPSNHLPDMTVNELLLELGKLFSLGFYFDNDAMTLELYFRKGVVENQAFKDISDKTNPRYELTCGQNEGFRIAYRWNTKDLAYNPSSPGEMAPVVVGNGKNSVEFKLFTAYMRKNLIVRTRSNGVSNWHGVKVPFVNQPGAWNKMEVPSDPRLLFFYGWQKNYDNEDYAFASADNFDFYGDSLGELTLVMVHMYDSTLYEKTLKPWYEFLMIDQQVDREGYWSIIDLLNHNEKKKYRVDQIRYLIKRISYSVSTRKGLGPVKLEMLKAE